MAFKKGQPTYGKGKKELKLNDYETPKYAWDEIITFIPRDKKIYEPFYLNGSSGNYLKSKGLDVIHEDADFYANAKDLEYDYILSNPPFQGCKKLFTFLKELNKPFVLLLPSVKIHTRYFAEFFKDEELQIIIPRRRIHFIKFTNGKAIENWKKGTPYDCQWFCWKMNLPKSVNYSYIK